MKSSKLLYSKFLFLLILSATLVGCSTQYVAQSGNTLARVTEIKPKLQLQRMRQINVPATYSVCAAPVNVEDVEFQQTLSEQLHKSLLMRFASVTTLTAVESQVGALRAARTQQCDLLLYPTVIDREDKIWSVSEWGEPQTDWTDIGVDKLRLGLTVWDVNGSLILDRAVVKSRTGWLDLYASNSMDLIGDSLEKYFSQLVALR